MAEGHGASGREVLPRDGGGEAAHVLRPLAEETVGRVEEDDVDVLRGGRGVEPSEQVAGDDRAAVGDAQGRDVFLQAVEGGPVGFEEGGVGRAAAERFEAHAPRAGETVVDAGAVDHGGEDVEQRLLHPVGDGARDVAGGGEEPAPAELAGDDAHGAESTQGRRKREVREAGGF